MKEVLDIIVAAAADIFHQVISMNSLRISPINQGLLYAHFTSSYYESLCENLQCKRGLSAVVNCIKAHPINIKLPRQSS